MWKSIRRYHFFYHRKGFYKFLRSISVKFGVIMAVILVGLYAFELLTPGVSHYFGVYSTTFSKELVFTFFFISETLLGLIPPDLFIVWAKQFASPYAVVTILAFLSYLAGLLAYYLGVKLVAIEKMREYIYVKFEKQFAMLRSWGGLIIVIAALLPLPFSTMCLGAGMLKFSFRTLAILGIFRIARFFAYAAVLYQVV
jgi:membrane protein YqaA with SNARE-associated domain